MNLTEIQIDCHGLWRNVTLPARPRAVTVYYGPNEAGKSTVRDFIRGVLYGFARAEGAADSAAGMLPPAGSLAIETASGEQRVHRTAAPAAEARLMTGATDEPADDALSAALQGIDGPMFDRVYSFGLRELTDFSLLSGEDVARHLFGLALGRDGERILEAVQRVDVGRARLIDPLQTAGALVELFERHDELSARLRRAAELRDRHGEWSLRCDQLEREIADLRLRLQGTRAQLRGHEFLERVWGPWNRLRECRQELETLPEIADFPERGIERLERLEGRIAAAAETRDRLLAEARRARDDLAAAAEDASWNKHAGAIRGFVEQRGWYAELTARCDAARQQLADRERELAESCARIGEGWTAERIRKVDVSASGQRRLSGIAESLLAAQSRRKALKWKHRQMAEACRDLKESLAESLHELGERPIEAALADARDRLGELTEVAALRIREVELSERLASLEQQRQRIMPQTSLPRWVYAVLGVFAFMGVILAGWGLVAGIAMSGIAGAIYAMLGVTCAGLAWGLKIQYEGDARGRLADTESTLASNQSELQAVRESIRQHCGDVTSEPAELVARAQEQISELVELAANRRRLRGMRRQLKVFKKSLATARREVATARHHWQELLLELGFPATEQVGEALGAWQMLAEAAERLRDADSAHQERRILTGIRDGFRQRVLDLARRSPESDNSQDPLELLAAWEERLIALERRQNERRESRKLIKARLAEVRRHGRRVRSAKLERDALFVQGGAATRDEFEQRALAFARRTYLLDQCHDAQHDLDSACAAHGDLALVEEDLERFEPHENAECIRTLSLELVDLERDLERAFEHLGGVRKEIEALENDRQATHVRFDLCRVEEQIRAAASEWFCWESSAQAIEEIRRDYERKHQPRALAEAAKIFARLTCGKYVRVWTPLGKRRLIVEDDCGRSFPLQSLSRGTREQLLLAVRLALVRELAARGMAMPLILDDVLVNFDEERAAAAAQVLQELADEGQQVLFFTCHKHLAQLFASRGIEPVWLPGRSAADQAPEEKRLAG